MRERRVYESVETSPRLFATLEERRTVYFTEGATDEPLSVYGERLVPRQGATLRRWEPSRSKLGAALAKGYQERLPRPGERWLYLGAATGTTASHVADLVGPEGRVDALERSVRPFARLLKLADRYPNLLPIFADARRPESYAGDIGPVDGLYADIAQPDQVEIVLANARMFLSSTSTVLFVLKTASMGRAAEPRDHLATARAALESAGLEIVSVLGLEPFHKRHYLITGAPTRAMFRPVADPTPVSSPRGRPAAP
ncbi:MAG TPA: fibrillarin-like rRNA/tRNA 2'-O-methyltransferase [Thermoplasmata archaeon]